MSRLKKYKDFPVSDEATQFLSSSKQIISDIAIDFLKYLIGSIKPFFS